MFLNKSSWLQAVFTVLPIRFGAGVRRLVGAAGSRRSAIGDAGVLGQALFDVICVAIFVAAVLFLQSINAGEACRHMQTCLEGTVHPGCWF